MPNAAPKPQAKPQRKTGADFTGLQTERLNEAKKVEKAEAAQRVTLMTAAAAEMKNTIIDVTNSEEPIMEIQPRKVEVTSPFRVIRTNTTLNQVTFGRKVLDPGNVEEGTPAIMGSMNMYDFEEGQPYRVPKELAEHLNGKGYLSYMGEG